MEFVGFGLFWFFVCSHHQPILHWSELRIIIQDNVSFWTPRKSKSLGQMLSCNLWRLTNYILRHCFEVFKCCFWIAFSALTFHLLFSTSLGFWGMESNTSLQICLPLKRKIFLLVSSSVLLLYCILSANRRWLTGGGILSYAVYWSLFPLGRWRGCIRYHFCFETLPYWQSSILRPLF